MKETEPSKELGFFLPNKELSWIIALLLAMSFLMFCTGYFLGQRRAIAQFLYKVKEESFADNITYSLYALNSKESFEESENAEESSQEDSEEREEESEEIIVSQTPEIKPTDQQEIDESSDIVYAAALVGFGTRHAADIFAQRTERNGIPVIIKQRSSKTQRGRKIVWYQATTKEYTDKTDLEKIIDQVGKQENIKNIKIIQKKKG
jgi:hypothetical protein